MTTDVLCTLSEVCDGMRSMTCVGASSRDTGVSEDSVELEVSIVDWLV